MTSNNHIKVHGNADPEAVARAVEGVMREHYRRSAGKTLASSGSRVEETEARIDGKYRNSLRSLQKVRENCVILEQSIYKLL